MLLQRRGAERSAAANRSINRPRSLAFIFNRNLDPRTYGAPVRLHSHEFHIDPVVPVAGILEKSKRMFVPGHRTTRNRQDVLISIASDIGKRHPMPLMQLAGAGRLRYIGEEFSIVIPQ